MDYKINHNTNILYKVLSALACSLILFSCSDEMELTGDMPATPDVELDLVPLRIKTGMVDAYVTKARVLSTDALDDMALFMLAEEDNTPDGVGEYHWCAPAQGGGPAMPELATAPRYNESVRMQGGSIVWPNEEKQYYPTGGSFSYSFTCISPRIDNEKYIAGLDTIQCVDTLETLSHVVARYAIDGRQDIIWGTCHGTDLYQWSAHYYRYHRVEDGMGGYVFDAATTDPSLTLHHLLASFTFNIECTGSDEDLTDVVIDSLTIDDVPYRLMLHVGEKGRIYRQDDVLVPDYTTAYYRKDLPLLTEEGDTVGLDNLMYGSQRSGSMMLYPSNEYMISLYMHHKGEENIDDAPSEAEGVDLGLPSGTKWANMNIGAETPEGSGLYFAWGETEGYGSDTGDGRVFDWAHYKWCDGSSNSLTKYNDNSSYGAVDNKTVIDLEDDAAAANWGGDWRMPTSAEVRELIDNTTKERYTMNGVYGTRFTSNVNGKSIFIPAVGYRHESSLYGAGYNGLYWAASYDEEVTSTGPYGLGFSGSSAYMGYCYRDYGLNVRAVLPAESDREDRRGWSQRVTRKLTLGEGSSFDAGHHYTVDIHVSGTRFESETEEDQ